MREFIVKREGDSVYVEHPPLHGERIMRRDALQLAAELIVAAEPPRGELDAIVGEILSRRRVVPPPGPRSEVCPGMDSGGTAPPCCDRAGEYNGYDSGPLAFMCPKSCACHD